MNFAKLGSSSNNSKNSTQGSLVSSVNRIKDWFLPRTGEGRKAIVTLLKDIGVFVVATSLLCIFKDDIKKLFEEDNPMADGFDGLGL